MNRKKRSLAALIVGFIGLCSLLLGVVRFQAYRPADVVELIASGMCVGIALGVVLWQRNPAATERTQSEPV